MMKRRRKDHDLGAAGFLTLNSTLLYHAAPRRVTNIPAPFSGPTRTLKRTIPRRMVRHCLRLPQTLRVKAPASLFVWNEVTLSMKARMPFPSRARTTEELRPPSETKCPKRVTSPVQYAYTRDCAAARGDMRRSSSRAGSLRLPVRRRLVATVC
jgi:hypothetical protein